MRKMGGGGFDSAIPHGGAPSPPRGSTSVKKDGWQHGRVGAGVKGGGMADLASDMRGGGGLVPCRRQLARVNIARGVQGKDN